jgi:hypothetical protein
VLLLFVSLNEHDDKPGAVKGNKDIKLLFIVDTKDILLFILFALLGDDGDHFFEAVNFGLPRFLCLMSIHVSHFPSDEQRLQGRDTIKNLLLSYCLNHTAKYIILTITSKMCLFTVDLQKNVKVFHLILNTGIFTQAVGT